MIEHLEILVEERSAEVLVRALLPRFLTKVTFEVYAHQGKHDLLAKLPSRLVGYSRWLPANWRIVVLVDRDDDDCRNLKERMCRMAVDAGFNRSPTAFTVANRIAIEELEAWYFGDWTAVRQVFPRLHPSVPQKMPYRDPDAIVGGTWEAFERLLQAAGYMKGGLRKIETAREIGNCLEPDRNTSVSFGHFWRVVTS